MQTINIYIVSVAVRSRDCISNRQNIFYHVKWNKYILNRLFLHQCCLFLFLFVCSAVERLFRCLLDVYFVVVVVFFFFACTVYVYLQDISSIYALFSFQCTLLVYDCMRTPNGG